MSAHELSKDAAAVPAARIFLPGVPGCALLEEQSFRDAVGLSPARLADRVITGGLFFIEHEGRRLYPEFFADPSLNPSFLEAVSTALRTVSAGGRLMFFLSRRGSLGGASVLDALREGRLQRVLAAAEAFAETRCEPMRAHCAGCSNDLLLCPEYQLAVSRSAAG